MKRTILALSALFLLAADGFADGYPFYKFAAPAHTGFSKGLFDAQDYYIQRHGGFMTGIEAHQRYYLSSGGYVKSMQDKNAYYLSGIGFDQAIIARMKMYSP